MFGEKNVVLDSMFDFQCHL